MYELETKLGLEVALQVSSLITKPLQVLTLKEEQTNEMHKLVFH